MTTDRDFNNKRSFDDRDAYDRPLNDRLSDVSDEDKTAREPAFDDGVTDKRHTDSTVDDRADDTVDDTTTVDTTTSDTALSDTTTSDTTPSDTTTVDDKAVINDQPDESALAYDDEAQQEPVATGSAQQETRTKLFEEHEAEQFRTQWREVQAGFVDEPRSAVREADSLVGKMLDDLKRHIDEQKRALNGDWDSDGKDTEELRLAFQRYRGLFDQILSV
jgi:hypothetical protein